jgi:hypothetical protein
MTDNLMLDDAKDLRFVLPAHERRHGILLCYRHGDDRHTGFNIYTSVAILEMSTAGGWPHTLRQTTIVDYVYDNNERPNKDTRSCFMTSYHIEERELFGEPEHKQPLQATKQTNGYNVSVRHNMDAKDIAHLTVHIDITNMPKDTLTQVEN